VSTGTQVEVVMPQMGVSVSEGTITRWLKQPGESVALDEPLLEISTDKVDTEVPSPGEGVLSEVRVQEGETVEVGTVLAVIGAAGSAPSEPVAPAEPPADETPTAAPPPPAAAEPPAPPPPATAPPEPVAPDAPPPAIAAPGSGNGKTFV
jgi:2-oxoglutarate dehydrogenase E2 component (dihydrolipoamide succinyltransferase)